MKLINCTHFTIFKLILENKPTFEALTQEFFKYTIKPLFANNDSKKLRLTTTKDHSLFVKNAFPPLDITLHTSNLSGGGQFYQQAFLYYLSTDLSNWTKYFHKNDLNCWLFQSGINDLQKKYDSFPLPHAELLAFQLTPFSTPNIFTHYTRSWYQILNTEFYRDELRSKSFILECFKLSTLDSTMSDGYVKYLESLATPPLKIPKSITNKMDFNMWKTVISNTRITQKNIKEIMYFNDFDTRWGFKSLMKQHIWDNYPHIANKKYFKAMG